MHKVRRSIVVGAVAGLALAVAPAVAIAGMGGTHAVQTFNDASGKVTITVFEADGNPAQEVWTDQDLQVPDPAMIAIGGGATATDQGNGAFLTASYPDGDLSGWRVSAKDHIDPQAYNLKEYVIGMKIAGIPRAQLADFRNGLIAVSHDTSSAAPHPTGQTGLDSNTYAMLGGGFKVDYHGWGNMATASFPYGGNSQHPSTTWKTASMDHTNPDPASIETWAIGLKLNLPIGHVLSQVSMWTSSQASHPNATVTLPSGYALTGGGAEVHYHGWGNMLWNLQPSADVNPSFTAGSADHEDPDPSTLDVYALGIKIV